MIVRVDAKATERQMKYLGWLSRQGKEVYGEEFSVRKLANQLGYTWPPTRKEASELIDKVKQFIDEGLKSQEFSVSTQDIIDELEEKKKQEQMKTLASTSPQVYMIQIFVDESKLKEVESFLDHMEVGYIVYKEAVYEEA
ncbi:hypothetical protein H5T89_07445 [bacterium]|nr:hypothetical protein [bacterium]